ncbi:MAG: hypothetical protein EOM23_08425, partial [Candidatus Moranbacteria bacterium]|nr:hypothetical protein [Candidatus Moranbacteria bacterium]
MRKLIVSMAINCIAFFIFDIVFAETPIFDEIKTVLHVKSWYSGCPECRDKFETAYREVIIGSDEWKELIDFHCGCLIEDHREAEAISVLNKALEVDPDNYLFMSSIGTAYLRLNDIENAEKYYEKSNNIKINRISSYHLAHVHLVKGTSIDISKDKRIDFLEKSENEINAAISMYESNDHISRYAPICLNVLLAHIKFAQGDIGEFCKIMTSLIKNVESATDWPYEKRLFWLAELYGSYGTMLHASGKKQDGIEFLNKSIETAPTQSLKEMKKILLDLTVNPSRDGQAKVSSR